MKTSNNQQVLYNIGQTKIVSLFMIGRESFVKKND